MFGEFESESPRVPSPWETLMSTPPSSTPPIGVVHNSSPLSLELVPKLVPESDDGNVEYKLQLLNPSPNRFARLVTQLKWRLLEGGGQAYYELGVADSGDLVGLSRAELERSLETLEMMAGEIGASVIVVKEIEVPAGLANPSRTRKDKDVKKFGTPSSLSSTDGGYSSNTSATKVGTEIELDSDLDDMQKTIMLSNPYGPDENVAPIFTMDSETEDTSNTTEEDIGISLRYDLEICSVFKPRPLRVFNHTSHLSGSKNKRNKKVKQVEPIPTGKQDSVKSPAKGDKSVQRRQNRDKRREEKRKGSESQIVTSVQNVDDTVSKSPERDKLVVGLKALHVTAVEELQSVNEFETLEDDNLFTAKPSLPSFPTFTTSESHLDVDPAAIAAGFPPNDGERGPKTLIVEALVVLKMLHHEAFLDFGGFAVT